MSADAPRFTLDANVLVYTVDRRAGARRAIVLEILDRAATRDCWLMLQAISEFYAAATRKGLLERRKAAELASAWLTVFPTATASPDGVRAALADAASGRMSYYDGLIVATAAEAGCGAILSEDMADGARFGGVEIVNPFAGDALSARAAALLGSGEAAL
jgi:predicted nucleic acid-binding protein